MKSTPFGRAAVAELTHLHKTVPGNNLRPHVFSGWLAPLASEDVDKLRRWYLGDFIGKGLPPWPETLQRILTRMHEESTP